MLSRIERHISLDSLRLRLSNHQVDGEHESAIPHDDLVTALYIRASEEALLKQFSLGNVSGTIHTCVGQELAAVSVTRALDGRDKVTSNHRCHGHFIGFTGDWKGLLAEVLGLEMGVCRGIGSSQHLCSEGFLSNGTQASLAPVGTGMALSLLNEETDMHQAVAVTFVGEGTFGEGALYEALNLSSILQAPQLFVCEDNFYAQSTPQAYGTPGSLIARAESFGLECFTADCWNVEHLFEKAQEAIKYVRDHKRPAFFLIETYRLNAHSKGDDDRNPDEVSFFAERDVLNRMLRLEKWSSLYSKIEGEIDDFITQIPRRSLSLDEYVGDQLPRKSGAEQIDLTQGVERLGECINDWLSEQLERGAWLIGEDVADPYGGAFKITKGLSSRFPDRVLNSSISEAGLVGVAIGIALSGSPAYAEIMFGDFVTNCMDQIVNNASKMHHMYAKQLSVPLRIRLPMGGHRGYGPTHSQSLEKFLVGIDNLCVVAISSLSDPRQSMASIAHCPGPVLIIENKLGYARRLYQAPKHWSGAVEDQFAGSVVLTPSDMAPTLTVVTYGELAREIADNLERLFEETEEIIELVCLQQLHPLRLDTAIESASRTGRVLVVEEGSTAFGIAAEVVAQLHEQCQGPVEIRRIGAREVPIPSPRNLEAEILVSMKRCVDEIHNFQERSAP